jgi:hypothetical protein
MLKVFCLNSIKERISNLNIILPNILKQCDVLHINTIGYDLDLNSLNINNINKIELKKFNDLGSEGRLIYYNQYNENTFYFTIDDDILYPENYSNKIIETYNTHQNSIICVHGSNLIDNQKKDYRFRNVIHFTSKLETPKKVQFPGVGTSCFKKGVLKIEYSDFKTKNMSDPYVGLMAKKQNIPIYSICREKLWLKPLNEFGKKIYGNNPIKEINNILKNFNV